MLFLPLIRRSLVGMTGGRLAHTSVAAMMPRAGVLWQSPAPILSRGMKVRTSVKKYCSDCYVSGYQSCLEGYTLTV